MRIATGGVMHETSTFAAGTTTLRDFEGGKGLLRGAAMLDLFRGANFCGGGFMEGAEKHGFELVPLLWTFATPSALIERATYDGLKEEFLAGLRREHDEGLDGVLLDLHGAMVVDGIEDADADFMAAVREVVGAKIPVIVTTDLHSNHSAARVAASTAIVGYDTYPHIDMAERGREAADLIVRTIRGEVQPVSAICTIPLIWAAECQVTAHPPMSEAMEQVFAAERRPGILTVTLATGFPWADVSNMGASVMVFADGDQALAQRTADEIGDWIWERRERWYVPPMTVEEGLAAGLADGRTPIILADMADNTGGGAPGEFDGYPADIRRKGPAGRAPAHHSGPGGRAAGARGGGRRKDFRRDRRQVRSPPGPACPARGGGRGAVGRQVSVRRPRCLGTDGNLGLSAWLRHRGVNIVVVSVRMQPLDQAFARSLGIDCAAMQIIAVKSAVHFRSGFERLGGPIFNVNAPAMHSHDYTTLTYRRRAPVYPVELT